MIFIAKGKVKLGREPMFEENPDGPCVVVGEIDSETMEVREPITDFYADWNVAGWLGAALERMKPTRPDNLPPLRQIVENIMEDRSYDGNALCDYCTENKCETCIIHDWVEEYRDRKENT